jgi:hypothetical protein
MVLKHFDYTYYQKIVNLIVPVKSQILKYCNDEQLHYILNYL